MEITSGPVQNTGRRFSGHALLGRARLSRQPRIGDVAGIKPGVAPALLVVFGETLVGEANHAVKGTGAARIPERLDADILVVAGVVHLVELVAAAELRADRIPQQLEHLDA